MFKLYDYFRSSACYRVRIALNLKNIPYEQVPIHLVEGKQASEHFLKVNPQGLVPALVLPQSHHVLTQSLAIIEYLEETFTQVPLLPKDALAKANVRALAQIIACDIHPLNNLRVLKYLKHTFSVDDEQKMKWYFHWLKLGFDAFEAALRSSGAYCFGDTPTLADVCLIPQVYNALRFDFALDNYPHIQKIHQHCAKHAAFMKALPENQPDAS